MRSFSQSQNKVVFLFVGAALFSELEQSNWSCSRASATLSGGLFKTRRCHPLNHRTRQPELSARRLRTNVSVTQGHPALLQLLCSKMVDIANTENKKDMHQADLDAVVQEVSNERETSAILIFWKDFCSEPACKQTAKRILNGETIEPNQHLYRLEEHGFIVEKEGRWQMRVPLFTLWLKRFAERVV